MNSFYQSLAFAKKLDAHLNNITKFSSGMVLGYETTIASFDIEKDIFTKNILAKKMPNYLQDSTAQFLLDGMRTREDLEKILFIREALKICKRDGRPSIEQKLIEHRDNTNAGTPAMRLNNLCEDIRFIKNKVKRHVIEFGKAS